MLQNRERQRPAAPLAARRDGPEMADLGHNRFKNRDILFLR